MIAPTKLRAVDLFCGAGGMTLGAERSGAVDVTLAVNHWQTAIFSHETNHPQTRHICARIEDMDLRNEHDLPDIDLIMGGIECTHHSNARGSAPVNDQRRTSAWRVLDWVQRFRPAWCVFENVREFEKWGPIDENGRKIKSRAGEIFNAWVAAVRSHGYHVEWKLLNAAEFGEATKRLRLFIICRRGESTTPFQWPEPTHGDRSTIQKELRESFRCNRQRERTAAEIIDWSRPCPSIFTRKRPLAEKTLRRIEIGLKKFVEPYLVYLKGTASAASVRNPLGTVQAQGTHWAVATPFAIDIHNRRVDDTSRSLRRPMPTVVAKPGNSIAMPFFLQRQGIFDSRRDKPPVSFDRPLNTITASHSPGHVVTPMVFAQGSRCDGRPASRPMPTLMAGGQPWLAVPFQYQLIGRGAGRSREVNRPLPTLVAAREHHGVVMPYMINVNHGGNDSRTRSLQRPLNTITTKRGLATIFPFLTKYYGTASAVPVNRPLDTVTTKDRYALTLVQTMRRLGVVDIGFRMLDVDELAAAQGFPRDYYLHGNKADQIRQVGNAVCPGVMKAICQAIGSQ